MFNVKLAATLVVALMMFSGAAVMVGTEDDDATGTVKTLYVTGDNQFASLGTGDTTNLNEFTNISISGVDSIDSIYSFNRNYVGGLTLIKATDGKLYGAGYNQGGQLGINSTTTPISTFTEMVDSSNYSFDKILIPSNAKIYYLTDAGTVYTTGASGDGTGGLSGNKTVLTQMASSYPNIEDIQSSASSTYILQSDGTLKFTGVNSSGLQGDGSTTKKSAFSTSKTDIEKFWFFSGMFTFALTSDGKLFATGDNTSGELGLGDNTNKTTWTEITNTFGNVKEMYCGFTGTSVFLLNDQNELYATGLNTSGQLGLGNTTDANVFTKITTDMGTITDVIVTATSAYVLNSQGQLFATGSNSSGQLGTGDNNNLSTFTRIGSDLGVITKVANEWKSLYVLNSQGQLFATGENTFGQLGTGDENNKNTFVRVALDAGTVYDVVATTDTALILAAPPTATVTVTPNDSDYGTVSPASITDIEPGDTITIANNTITYGETVVTATPAEADAQYTYAFSGFVDSNSDPVTGTVTVNSDMTITAVFTATTNQYAVTISPNDPSYGSISPSSLTVDYGTAITVDGTSLTIGSTAVTATASDATAQYTYAFDSWTVPGAVETVTGPITITGTFTATVNEYTVTIESADVTLGTVDVSEVQDVPYGTAITVSGDTVTIGDTTITATVIGSGLVTKWSVSDGATVTGDMTITASFVEPSSIENTLMGMLPFLLIIVLVITAAGGVFASGGNPEDLIKLIICLAVGVIIISVFVLPIAGGL